MNRALIRMSDNPTVYANQYPVDRDTFVTFGYDGNGAYSEVYTGANYVPGSTKRSYSRIYRGKEGPQVVALVPKKYKVIVRELYDTLNDERGPMSVGEMLL